MPHFDLTIDLGNILTILTFLIVAVLAWNNLSWRIKQIEDWRQTHEHSTIQALANITMLREAVVKLTTLVDMHDSHIKLLSDFRTGRHQ